MTKDTGSCLMVRDTCNMGARSQMVLENKTMIVAIFPLPSNFSLVALRGHVPRTQASSSPT